MKILLSKSTINCTPICRNSAIADIMSLMLKELDKKIPHDIKGITFTINVDYEIIPEDQLAFKFG